MWLNLLAPALRLAAGTAQAKASLTRLAAAFGLLLVALILAVAALAFALWALYAYLATVLTDPAAAAITAAITLALAALVAAAALYRPRRRRMSPGDGRRLGEGIESVVDGLGRWARRNPWEAAAAAFVIGVFMGTRR
jgi:membrane protein implicated in regulation of membrane protease activity